MSRELVQITDNVWVATSRNHATTSTIVAKSGRALLIDPAWEPDELTGLAESIQELGLQVSCGFHTHAHHDHLLWYGAFGPAPRWVTPLTLDMIGRFGTELRGEDVTDSRRQQPGGEDTYQKLKQLAADYGNITANR